MRCDGKARLKWQHKNPTLPYQVVTALMDSNAQPITALLPILPTSVP
jgi:hypothetical protein